MEVEPPKPFLMIAFTRSCPASIGAMTKRERQAGNWRNPALTLNFFERLKRAHALRCNVNPSL